ncbi:hypothetical protein ACEN2I_06375 [Flavobacterium sp. W22_SRS_FK3]|uniref:hypothetical protein n=1 Tax=Flavobacterium sp. W22_SRS_FK3 TaxID=3240275 RepID=UPI003F8F5110
MENLKKNKSDDLQSDSLHSQICLADNIDFIYRKSYKGDWGHWDDLPDNAPSNLNRAETTRSRQLVKGSAGPYENSYL